jgi:ADP-ribosylglycohydrolase
MTADVDERRRRARVALEGLSLGDAFGERFMVPPETAVRMIELRAVPGGTWRWTDDTEMALSIVEQLEERGAIDQDDLAQRFARRMDLDRGYGRGAIAILDEIRAGASWRSAATAAFDGAGSLGNGAAMRVAPVGAYFSNDLDRAVEQAAASAEITHAHADGIAGAVAVAAATALATAETEPRTLVERVRDRTPRGATRDGIDRALALLDEPSPTAAANVLGNGSGVSAADTVPFCLWVVARHLRSSYEEALWDTVRALGDRDTTCAIVGGILATRFGLDGIPAEWRQAREPLS